MNVTPENITDLAADEVFVYGANSAGRHGKGAAKTAMKWGAVYGRTGYAGKTFGIPTKDKYLNVLSIAEIKEYVDLFVLFAKNNPNLKFLITEIGCGLSNYNPKDIAPLFIEASKLNNVWLPARFWDVINK